MQDYLKEVKKEQEFLSKHLDKKMDKQNRRVPHVKMSQSDSVGDAFQKQIDEFEQEQATISRIMEGGSRTREDVMKKQDNHFDCVRDDPVEGAKR